MKVKAEMSPSDLIAAGERIYGPQWRSKLATALGVDVSTLRRWTTGQVAIPRTTALAVKRLEDEHRNAVKTRMRFTDGDSLT